MYYLQSRYYDPEVGRFLNADIYVATGQGILGNNMCAYCRNNPACRVDSSGTEDVVAFSDDEILSDDDLDERTTGGGGNSTSSGRGFLSFGSLKKYLGSPGSGNHWHHIVEQCQIDKSGFSPEQIHNTSNVVAVSQSVHAQITGYYNTTTFQFTNGLSVRNWLAGQPYQVQYDFGVGVLQQFGVK